MRTTKNITVINTLALTVLAVLFGGNAAMAFPAFSQKEKKPCAFCHENPKGGGKRTAAGLWYKAHGLSFAGYAPAKPGAPGKPAPKKGAGKPAPKKTPPKPAPKKKG